ncbi:MAG: cyanoexosortase B [Geitlerinemataceae cyanobacterium]
MQVARLTKRYPLEIAIFTAVAVLYAPIVLHWVDGWLNKSISIEHEYFSHGLIGLPFAAYIAWTERDRWRELPDRFDVFGAACLGLSTAFYASNIWDFVNLSFPLTLVGLILCMKGKAGVKLLAFPLILTLFATPTNVPYLLAPYTLPLQKFIAGTAGFILTQFGMDVDVRGILLFVNDRVVEVAPYCAGLKMLFTTLYVAFMLLFWTGAAESRKTIVIFITGAIGLSVFINILRNTLLTYFHGTGNDAMFHWVHDSWGGDMISAVMLLMLIPMLNALEWLRHAFTGPDMSGEI